MSSDVLTLLFMVALMGTFIIIITIAMYHGAQTDKNALFKDCTKLLKHANGDIECQK
jgi:hypothetical protein